LEGVHSYGKTPSFFGSIHHPVNFKIIFIVLCIIRSNIFKSYLLNVLKAGEIAVELVKQGFAICQYRSMKYLKGGADKLRAAERHAKENKLRIWKSYKPTGPEVLIISLRVGF